MLKIKDWLKNKNPEIQFRHDFKKFVETGRKTVIRISDGAEFFEGQVIELMLMEITINRFQDDHIHVDVTLESDAIEPVPHVCEINQLFNKKGSKEFNNFFTYKNKDA